MQKYATLYALSIFLCIWLSFLYSARCPKLWRNEDRRHCSTSSDLLSSLLATLSDSVAESSWVVVSTCTLALSSCGSKSTLLPSTERTVVAIRHSKPLLSRQAVITAMKAAYRPIESVLDPACPKPSESCSQHTEDLQRKHSMLEAWGLPSLLFISSTLWLQADWNAALAYLLQSLRS